MSTTTLGRQKQYVLVRSATVRFAGDSGDGMQLAGSQFADIVSMSGAVVRTLPDFPSEIRAPAGSLGGVSGFQVSFGDQEVRTPGDSPFVLVAMNPAALKVNLPDLQPGGIMIVDEDEFTPRTSEGRLRGKPAGRDDRDPIRLAGTAASCRHSASSPWP